MSFAVFTELSTSFLLSCIASELKFYLSVSLKTNLRLLQILGWMQPRAGPVLDGFICPAPGWLLVFNRSPIIAVKSRHRKTQACGAAAPGCAAESKEDSGRGGLSSGQSGRLPVAVLPGHPPPRHTCFFSGISASSKHLSTLVALTRQETKPSCLNGTETSGTTKITGSQMRGRASKVKGQGTKKIQKVSCQKQGPSPRPGDNPKDPSVSRTHRAPALCC